MIEPIERMRKLVNDNLVMNLRFQMNRELNELEREIEQELNSRAERTCEFNIKDNMNETEGMGDVWIECSACNCVFDFYADIVRCRDCVYFDKYENDEISVCYRFDNEQPIVEPDGFCAWGERRTDDN